LLLQQISVHQPGMFISRSDRARKENKIKIKVSVVNRLLFSSWTRNEKTYPLHTSLDLLGMGNLRQRSMKLKSRGEISRKRLTETESWTWTPYRLAVLVGVWVWVSVIIFITEFFCLAIATFHGTITNIVVSWVWEQIFRMNMLYLIIVFAPN